jgi:hypothetical protein
MWGGLDKYVVKAGNNGGGVGNTPVLLSVPMFLQRTGAVVFIPILGMNTHPAEGNRPTKPYPSVFSLEILRGIIFA